MAVSSSTAVKLGYQMRLLRASLCASSALLDLIDHSILVMSSLSGHDANGIRKFEASSSKR